MDSGELRFDDILMSSSPGRSTQEEENDSGDSHSNEEISHAEREKLTFTSNSQTRTRTTRNSFCRKTGRKTLLSLSSSRNSSATSLVKVRNGNDLSTSFGIWVNDVHALISSHEFQCAVTSSSELISATTGKLLHTALLPITVPVNITTSIASNAISAANGTICYIVKPFIVNNQQLSALEERTINGVADSHGHDDHCDRLTQCQPQLHEKLIFAAINVIPIAVGTISRVKDEIGSTLINVLGWHMPSAERSDRNETPSYQTCNPLKYHPSEKKSESQHDLPEEDSDTINSSESDTKYIHSSLTKEEVGNVVSPFKSLSGSSSSETDIRGDIDTTEISTFFMTISDLGLCKPMPSSSQNEVIIRLELKSRLSDRDILDTTCTKMVEMALFLSCINVDNRFTEITKRPAWKEEGSTSKYQKHYNKWVGNAKTRNKAIALLEKEVLTWSFTAKKKMSKKEVYGDGVPMFRARGIIPCSPLELFEILLDSSKVSLYNKLSNGRKDVCVLSEEGKGSGDGTVMTKIMRTETKVPFTGKVLQIQTLLHARKIKEEGNVGDSYVLVSRSVDSCSSQREEGNKARSKNEIIWGVNVLREVSGYTNKVELTNFSQASSTAVPNFLAHKIGLMSLNDFFKNLRDMQ